MSFKNALEAFVNAIEENQDVVFMPDRKINIRHIEDISPSFLNLGVKVRLHNGSSYETTSGMYETWKAKIIKMAQANDIRVIDTKRNDCFALVPANECHSLRQFVPESNTGLVIFNDQEDLVLAIGSGDYDAHVERFYALNNVTRVQKKNVAQVPEQKTEERKSAPSKVLILGKVIDLSEVEAFHPYLSYWGKGLLVKGKDGKKLVEDFYCDYNVEGKKLEKAMEAYLLNQ